MSFCSSCLEGNCHALQYLWSIWPHHVYPHHLQGHRSPRLGWLLAAWGLVEQRPELSLTEHMQIAPKKAACSVACHH